jgi:hypothetical protein
MFRYQGKIINYPGARNSIEHGGAGRWTYCGGSSGQGGGYRWTYCGGSSGQGGGSRWTYDGGSNGQGGGSTWKYCGGPNGQGGPGRWTYCGGFGGQGDRSTDRRPNVRIVQEGFLLVKYYGAGDPCGFRNLTATPGAGGANCIPPPPPLSGH